MKHFAFLKDIGHQYLNFVLQVAYSFFLRAADWPTMNFLGMYCYFAVISSDCSTLSKWLWLQTIINLSLQYFVLNVVH